jgi:hypothetical protein
MWIYPEERRAELVFFDAKTFAHQVVIGSQSIDTHTHTHTHDAKTFAHQVAIGSQSIDTHTHTHTHDAKTFAHQVAKGSQSIERALPNTCLLARGTFALPLRRKTFSPFAVRPPPPCRTCFLHGPPCAAHRRKLAFFLLWVVFIRPLALSPSHTRACGGSPPHALRFQAV